MKQWYIEGGIYTDETFQTLQPQTLEVYGPYLTRERAEKAWKGYMFAKVDNCLHRLQIIEEDVNE